MQNIVSRQPTKSVLLQDGPSFVLIHGFSSKLSLAGHVPGSFSLLHGVGRAAEDLLVRFHWAGRHHHVEVCLTDRAKVAFLPAS